MLFVPKSVAVIFYDEVRNGGILLAPKCRKDGQRIMKSNLEEGKNEQIMSLK